MEDKYLEGKIYRLLCSDGHFYYGSTIQKLNYRFNSHKTSSKKDSEQNVYKYINNIGWDKVKIELVEEFPCSCKKELNEREDYFIKKEKDNELCLNINRAHVSKEERKDLVKKYYEEHKDEIIDSHRFYSVIHKEKVDAYHAEYRKEHAEERREYSRKYAEEHPEEKKEFRRAGYIKNKEKEREQNKKYIEENKDKVKMYKLEWQRKKRAEESEKRKEEREAKKLETEKKEKEVHKCDCGGTYQFFHKNRHEASKKHQEFLKK
jgi:hypothetical protein